MARHRLRQMQMSDEPNAQHSEPQSTLRLATSGAPTPAPQQTMHADTGAEGGHLNDYLRVLHKRRWTAGTAFVIVLASVTT
jgi:hypothetical protein